MKVKQYSQRVAPDAVQQQKTSGFGQDSGLSSLGQSVVQVSGQFQQAQTEIDQTYAEEARLAFDRDITSIFHNADNGYFNTSGKDAYEQQESVLKKVEEARQAHSKALSPSQTKMFDSVAHKMLESGRKSVMQHGSRGRKAWDVATQEAVVENSMEKATLSFHNDQEIAVQLATMRAAVKTSADSQGVGAEATNERLQTATSKFYASVIARAIEDDTGRASGLLKRVEKYLEPDDQSRIKSALKQTTDKQTAMSTVDKWTSDKLTTSQAMAEAQKIKDPVLRAATENRFLKQQQIIKSEESRVQTEAVDRVYEAYSSNGEVRPQDVDAMGGKARLAFNNVRRAENARKQAAYEKAEQEKAKQAYQAHAKTAFNGSSWDQIKGQIKDLPVEEQAKIKSLTVANTNYNKAVADADDARKTEAQDDFYEQIQFSIESGYLTYEDVVDSEVFGKLRSEQIREIKARSEKQATKSDEDRIKAGYEAGARLAFNGASWGEIKGRVSHLPVKWQDAIKKLTISNENYETGKTKKKEEAIKKHKDAYFETVSKSIALGNLTYADIKGTKYEKNLTSGQISQLQAAARTKLVQARGDSDRARSEIERKAKLKKAGIKENQDNLYESVSKKIQLGEITYDDVRGTPIEKRLTSTQIKTLRKERADEVDKNAKLKEKGVEDSQKDLYERVSKGIQLGKITYDDIRGTSVEKRLTATQIKTLKAERQQEVDKADAKREKLAKLKKAGIKENQDNLYESVAKNIQLGKISYRDVMGTDIEKKLTAAQIKTLKADYEKSAKEWDKKVESGEYQTLAREAFNGATWAQMKPKLNNLSVEDQAKIKKLTESTESAAKKADEDAQSEYVESIMLSVEDGTTTYEQIKGTPAWGRLNSTQRKALKTRSDQLQSPAIKKQEALDKRKRSDTSWQTYIRLMKMNESDPETAMRAFYDVADRFDEAKRVAILKELKKKPKSADQINTTVTISSRIGQLTDDSEAKFKLMQDWDTFQAGIQATQQRKPNKAETDSFFKDAVTEVVTHKGMIWDSTSQNYEIDNYGIRALESELSKKKVTSEAKVTGKGSSRVITYPDGATKTGGSRSWRNNNPGNLEYGDFAKSQGAIGSDGRFAIFPDKETGDAAKIKLLKGSKYRDKTIEEAIIRYAPRFENDSAKYAAIIAKAASVPVGTTLSSLTDEQFQKMVDSMNKVEGWKEGKTK